jgi:hypothetical protein
MTRWARTAEVLGVWLRSPLYSAVREWVPGASEEVLRLAEPPLTADAPKSVAPSMNLTAPVAVPGETVAVRATVPPAQEGFVAEARTVVVATALFSIRTARAVLGTPLVTTRRKAGPGGTPARGAEVNAVSDQGAAPRGRKPVHSSTRLRIWRRG